MPRRRNQRRQAGEQLHRLHHAVGLAATPRPLQPVRDSSVPHHREPLEAQWCSRAIAEQSFTPGPIVSLDADAGVQVESKRLGAVLSLGTTARRDRVVAGGVAYQRLVEIAADGSIRVKAREQNELAQFCNVWMRNIREQQGLDVP